jgi:hypothetical protein
VFSRSTRGSAETAVVYVLGVAALAFALVVATAVAAGAKDHTPPTSPRRLEARKVLAHELTLTWQRSHDNVKVVGYRVFWDRDGVRRTRRTSFTVAKLSCGHEHQFAVAAYDAAGNSSTRTRLRVSTAACPPVLSHYDRRVLADKPVGFWDVAVLSSESDLVAGGAAGSYQGGTPQRVALPNGDRAADFDGRREYLTIPSSHAFSIATTGRLTWEAWVRPDTLQFPSAGSDGYVDVLGKCEHYGPTCEWESRFYSAQQHQGRCSRLSAYAFNPDAGLGSAADWQPVCGLFKPGEWLYVVGEYQTKTTPSRCNAAYPGTLDIWVDAIRWSFRSHVPTGCMSQYKVIPRANDSPLVVGTMARDFFFAGAVGKVAIYSYLLSQTQIEAHFSAMTGQPPPVGSCGQTCSFH